MSHVNPYNQRDADGIFLYDKYNRRIGGPYATEEEATRASKAVSEALGERPVEDYRKFLQETNPGILGGQSPVPQPRRELTDEEFEAIFNQRAREYREGLIREPSSPVDWFINPAEGQEVSYRGSTYDPALGSDSPPNYQALGLMPSEPEGLLSPGFVTDIKSSPKTYRVPIDPTPDRWGADISGVKFGTALPDRTAVEDMILEASSLSGVQPEYTEGHRTEEQNKLVGGDPASKHLQGQAFDLAISGDKSKDEAYARELRRLFGPLGFSVVLKSDHVHLQTPPPGVELLPNSSWR